MQTKCKPGAPRTGDATRVPAPTANGYDGISTAGNGHERRDDLGRSQCGAVAMAKPAQPAVAPRIDLARVCPNVHTHIRCNSAATRGERGRGAAYWTAPGSASCRTQLERCAHPRGRALGSAQAQLFQTACPTETDCRQLGEEQGVGAIILRGHQGNTDGAQPCATYWSPRW